MQEKLQETTSPLAVDLPPVFRGSNFIVSCVAIECLLLFIKTFIVIELWLSSIALVKLCKCWNVKVKMNLMCILTKIMTTTKMKMNLR